MCGIAGIISPNYHKVDKVVIEKMTHTLLHRGPDGSGNWISPGNLAGFGHTRLSILDLTEAGTQPMHFLERYTIIYNGEIYNFTELKDELIKKGFILQ